MPRDWLGAVSRLAASIGAAPDSAHAEIWNEVGPWVSKLLLEAGPRWVKMLAQNRPCAVPDLLRVKGLALPCEHRSIAQCDSCLRPTCLHHARIDQFGYATCFVCTGETIKRGQAENVASNVRAAATENQIKWALKELGLKRGASLDQVRTAGRRLLGKYHPDRYMQKSKKEQEEAAKKFQAIQGALRVLDPPTSEKAA